MSGEVSGDFSIQRLNLESEIRVGGGVEKMQVGDRGIYEWNPAWIREEEIKRCLGRGYAKAQSNKGMNRTRISAALITISRGSAGYPQHCVHCAKLKARHKHQHKDYVTD